MTTRVSKSYIYHVLCDRCGWKFKSNQVREDWKGHIVCNACYEPRHVLDFYQTRNDTHRLPFIRSDNNGVDVSPNYIFPVGTGFCTVTTVQPILDVGALGCFTFTS